MKCSIKICKKVKCKHLFKRIDEKNNYVITFNCLLMNNKKAYPKSDWLDPIMPENCPHELEHQILVRQNIFTSEI